jgi:signal transduction histidine kinase
MARHAGLAVATSRGIVRLDGDRFAPVPLPDAVRGAACLCMFADSADDLWAGTTAGVVHVGVAAADAVPVEDGTPLDAVALTEIATGRIVALARSGSLYELVDGRFRLRPDVPDLSSRARSIAIDADGSLWHGIYGSGITTVSGTTSRRFSMQQNGLPSSHVLAIVPWTDVMWVCSENGVFGCPLAEFAAAPPGRFPLPTWRVTEIEGLPEKVCTAGGQPVASLGPDRRLWVPNGRYVAGFSPGEIMEPMPVFPPVIERIIADGIDRELRPRTNQLLPVGTGRLEFHFTSPNTVAPERLQFRHQLVGFDAEWIDVADRRMVSYTGLPPGEYTFRLEVSDPMGSWRSLSRDLQFEIPPRFWQRRGVQAAAAAGLAGLLAAAGWAWERRRSRARLARLELERAREQERQRIARDIHDDLGSGLTEIVMLSDVASREAEGSPAASTAHAIADRARVLTRSMDEVVWAVNPRNDSAEGFITYFHRWAQAYLGNAGLRVRWDLPVETPDLPLAAEVRHHLFLACKEAVANVVKHAGATEARLTCRITPRGLDIGIADDGRGFVAGRSTEAGDGLANLRERLVAIGGTCDIRSKPGRGTHVRFFIPIDRAAGHPGPAQPR